MALLKIRVKAKVLISWGNASLAFIRNTNAIKDTTLSYSGAVNSSFSAGQVLYTQGLAGQVGYIQVSSKESTVLNGSGLFRITVEHYPSSTEGNKTITFNIDESPANLHLTYNSLPNIQDIIVETPNRTMYVFQASDFDSKYSDYDNDALTEIQINGDVSGIQLDGEPIQSGQWIAMGDVNAGNLWYVPENRSDMYEKNLTWKAKDQHGNISIN